LRLNKDQRVPRGTNTFNNDFKKKLKSDWYSDISFEFLRKVPVWSPPSTDLRFILALTISEIWGPETGQSPNIVFFKSLMVMLFSTKFLMQFHGALFKQMDFSGHSGEIIFRFAVVVSCCVWRSPWFYQPLSYNHKKCIFLPVYYQNNFRVQFIFQNSQ